jgi:2-polyprenyl-3-methyl-5-hydroxy-6-metoxy-1,4-benzoquinol methylase
MIGGFAKASSHGCSFLVPALTSSKDQAMRGKAEVLQDINRDLPQGLDWHAGARRNVQHHFSKIGRDRTERYALSKPLARAELASHLSESVAYLANLVNLLQFLALPPPARVMDVACGAGWLSHYLARLGYETFGFDIADDFIELARRRLSSDSLLDPPIAGFDGLFAVHNIEARSLGPEHYGLYDAIVLESCLHHFLDPISALTHLAPCLNERGVVVVIEGENRNGPIRDEYRKVMEETETLERPYSRKLLIETFELAGLYHYEFLGSVNGWFSLDDSRTLRLTDIARADCQNRNLAICAHTESPLLRVCPWRGQSGDTIRFGSGFHADEGSGWHWSGPSGQLVATRAIEKLQMFLLSEVPNRLGRSQTVFVHGAAGLRATVTLPDNSSVAVGIGPVARGEVLTLCSADFFVPALHGSNDTRQLSFALRIAP